MSAMYAHTCDTCGDTGIIIFDLHETRIDPCQCPPDNMLVLQDRGYPHPLSAVCSLKFMHFIFTIMYHTSDKNIQIFVK